MRRLVDIDVLKVDRAASRFHAAFVHTSHPLPNCYITGIQSAVTKDLLRVPSSLSCAGQNAYSKLEFHRSLRISGHILNAVWRESEVFSPSGTSPAVKSHMRTLRNPDYMRISSAPTASAIRVRAQRPTLNLLDCV